MTDNTPMQEAEADKQHMTLIGHLYELRRRLLWSLVVWALAFALAYVYARDIYSLLVQPLAAAMEGENRRLIYTGLAEAFVTYVRLALWVSGMVAAPFILVQTWLFIVPGLYEKERKLAAGMMACAPVLFALGASFAYFVVMPLAWKFFVGFEITTPRVGSLPVELEARVSEYLGFALGLMMAFGLVFELPIILLSLVRVGLVTPQTLRKNRRVAIVAAFVVAAVLTPPDVISQIALAMPIIIFYELSILLAGMVAPVHKP